MRLAEKKKPIKVGLVRGRHELPTDTYIFGEIEDVFDFDGMYETAAAFIQQNIGVTKKAGRAINSASYTDDEVYRGDRELVVYVTGLTAALAAVIAACAAWGVPLTLMHHDRETGDYRPQTIF